jgi:hypothetical protein
MMLNDTAKRTKPNSMVETLVLLAHTGEVLGSEYALDPDKLS